MRILLTSIFVLTLTTACQNQFRLPVGRNSTPKIPRTEQPTPPEMTSQPQPVEGSGNGNGGIDTNITTTQTPDESSSLNKNSFGHLYSEFRSYNQNKFDTGIHSYQKNLTDVLSETLWKELNLHSQFTVLVRNAVYHSNNNRFPDHLLMYVSQSEQGVLLINLMILPYGHHPFNDMFSVLKQGGSVIFPHASIPNVIDPSRKESFVVNLESLRADKNIILPYLSTDNTQIPEDKDFINLSESSEPQNASPKIVSKANKVLAICKDKSLDKELALSGEEEVENLGCEMELTDYTLHFGFTKEQSLLIIFESGSPSLIKMIAEVPLKDPQIYLDNRSPFRTK